MSIRTHFIFLLMLILPVAAEARDRFEEAPVQYSETPGDNAVTRLQASLASGEQTLPFDAQFGYLPALLEALHVPVSSQALVFSKTSLQNHAIAPETPRALYFNDEVYVGTVQGGDVLEVSVADPNLGTAFYTVSQAQAERPVITREGDRCLQCHGGTMTRGIPGHIVRSLYTGADGFPILKAGTFLTTQESPFEDRWGGWYVTGTHGTMRHMGNVTAVETDSGATLDRAAGANRETLPDQVNPDRYLTHHSDLVALMVLEHQAEMHNLITRASFDTRFALRDQRLLDEMTNTPPGTLSDSTRRRIAAAGDRLVDYMLFVNEAPLTSPVSGTSSFAEDFASRGPRDGQGRSLRTFDLETRLFKYPLSYLIYSEAFDSLPQEMRRYVYWRLWQILTGAEEGDAYAHLTPDIRKALREILLDTRPELKSYLD